MKQMIKYTLTIAALLLVTIGAMADGAFTVIKMIDGAAAGNKNPGEVVYKGNGIITVTPSDGYYLTVENLTVIKTLNGQYAEGRTREVGYENTPIALTPVETNPDPSGETNYKFDVTDPKYDYQITANFLSRSNIADATVTLAQESYSYTGEAIEPEVTVTLAGTALTADKDYTVEYDNNIDVPATANTPQPTITIKGQRTYTGTKAVTFTIAKADPTLTFSSATATYTFGQEFTKPTLTTTPAGLAVTYASSNENVAKVDEASGDITPVAVSTEAITITASFEGNDNYNAKDATYALTVAKGTAVVTKAPTAKANLTYTGEALALINAGECTTGNMQYKVGTDGTYSANIPTATDAKTYTVYYKDAGNSNYNASDEASITVTIGKAAGTISYAIASVSKTFGDDPFINDLTITGDGIVSYSSLNEDVVTVNEKTGEVTIKASGEATIKATVADKDGGNYTYETNTATYLLSIDTEAMEVSATAYTGTYDGEAHTITMTAPEDATVKYGTTEGNYNLDACPTYTNAGTYTVFYQVTKPNYTTVAGSQTVTINKAAGTISYAIANVNKTFGDDPFINDLTITGDGIVSYSSRNEDVATVNEKTGEVTIKASGEAYIEATVADKDGGNYTYETNTASYLLSIDTKAMEVSAIAYTGTYDGEAHTITMTAPEDATVKYGTTEGNYNLDACPTYTNAGTYTVFYQVTKPNYTTVAGSQTVTINKAAGSISFATANVKKTFGDDPFINELTITGDGIVSYSSQDENMATVNEKTGEVTIKGCGTAYIEATVADKDGGNYTYATKTATYTLTVEEAIEPEPEQVKYALWVGGKQVTSDNCQDILGDGEKDAATNEVTTSGSIVFNPDSHMLFIGYEGNENVGDLSIESRLPELTIYLRENVTSKLKYIRYNSVDDVEGNAPGILTFTTDFNHPGKLVMSTTGDKSAIWGFQDVIFDSNTKLAVIEPDNVIYRGEKMRILSLESNGSEPLVANEITIARPLDVTKQNDILLSNYIERDEKGQPKTNPDGTAKMVSLRNTVVKELQHVLAKSDDPESDEGLDNSDGKDGIAIEGTMTKEQVGEVADKVQNNEMTLTGSAIEEELNGLAFLASAGEGTIATTAKVDPGFDLCMTMSGLDGWIQETVPNTGGTAWKKADGSHHLPPQHETILSGASNGARTKMKNIECKDVGDGYVEVTIDYNRPTPTYCYLYLVKSEDASGARSIVPIGKRDKAHGKVVSINVNIVKKAPGNPASDISGGAIPKSEDIIDDDDDIITGIKVINNTNHNRVGNNKWYNLNGQQMDAPTKQGLYIINGKKIIIK